MNTLHEIELDYPHECWSHPARWPQRPTTGDVYRCTVCGQDWSITWTRPDGGYGMSPISRRAANRRVRPTP